jgi:hypothetical protein
MPETLAWSLQYKREGRSLYISGFTFSRIRYARGEHKEAMEVSVIQQIVQLGIEREELRDEILVQCMRQLTRNPHPEQVKHGLINCIRKVPKHCNISIYRDLYKELAAL